MLDEFDNTETTQTTQTAQTRDTTGEVTSAPTAGAASPATSEPDPAADTSGGTASPPAPGGELPAEEPPEPEVSAPAKKAAKRPPRKTARARKSDSAPAEGAAQAPAEPVAEGGGAAAPGEPAAEGGVEPALGQAAEAGAGTVTEVPAARAAARAGTAAKRTAAKTTARKTTAKRAPRRSAAGKTAAAEAQPEQLPLEEPAANVAQPAAPSPRGEKPTADEIPAAEAADVPEGGAQTTLPAEDSAEGRHEARAFEEPPADQATARQAGGEPEATPEADQRAAENAEDAETSAPVPPVAATSVLFKAPEPTAAPARRRKRTAPMEPAETPPPSEPPGTPERDGSERAASDAPAGASPVESPSEPLRDQEPEQAAGDRGQDAGEETDLDQGGSRRRRRRGGRRRRRGSGGDDATDESHDDSHDDSHDESHDDTAGDAGQPAEADVEAAAEGGRSRRRAEGGSGQKQRSGQAAEDTADREDSDTSDEGSGSRRRRRRRRSGDDDNGSGNGQATATRARKARSAEDEITSVSGSTRLEAKKQRRREGREAGRRRAPIVSEAEFLARREAVDRVMVIRQHDDLTQIAVLEDKVLVEHYVARESQISLIGNVYLGRVQNVLPSMEAAFVDIGKGRNAVLYAGEVNWDALGAGNGPRRIEQVLKSGQPILVQVTKDPVGHKGARLTSQVSLPGRFLVYVPDGTTSGISRKLPDTERNRLKTLLKDIVPDTAGVIVRTAAEGASEEELTRDVERLTARWADIERKVAKGSAPQLLYGEPDLTLKVVRDLFTEDIGKLVVSGDDAWDMVETYVKHVAPDLEERLERHVEGGAEGGEHSEVFAAYRIDEQIAKGLERKVWLPSGGSLIIDRTEAMTVVDVNTGKFTGSGGNLEETVTKNNLEAAEEIVRQLRLRDIGGIIVVDFIDMVLESNRDLVLRRLVECLGRDRTRHQVAEVTSLGLVQMTRKRIGTGLLEAFSETCDHCQGRGLIVHHEPVEQRKRPDDEPRRGRRGRARDGDAHDSGPGGNGSGRNGSAAPGPVRHAPTPADLAAMARHEPLHTEAGAPAPEPVPMPAAEPVPGAIEPPSAPPDATAAEPTPAVPAATTAEQAVAEPAAAEAEPAAAVADGEQTVAPPSTGVEPELDVEPMEPLQPVEPATRLVTSTRRRVARRPAGPPSTAEPYPPGDGVVSPDGSPALADSGPDAGVADEPVDLEQPHVPVKKRGRKH